MVPREFEIVSDDPFDNTEAGREYWREAVAIDAWIADGAPSPLEMWDRLQAAADAPEAPAPKLSTPRDVRAQGLASIEDACTFLGGISRDTFDRYVRGRVTQRKIGSRPYFLVASLAEFVETDAFKALDR